MEIPAHVVIPLATVVAALITGGIAFVNMTLAKEQKTSEFRQKWIDGLREDLAEFLASARAFARYVSARSKHGPGSGDAAKFPFSDERIGEIRMKAAQTLYRIKLRLNLNETDHKELERLLDGAVGKQNALLQAGGQDTDDAAITAEILRTVDAAANHARPVLKAEWVRVKKGELLFRVTRNWVAPAIVLLATVFVVYLLFGTTKPPQSQPVTPPAKTAP